MLFKKTWDFGTSHPEFKNSNSEKQTSKNTQTDFCCISKMLKKNRGSFRQFSAPVGKLLWLSQRLRPPKGRWFLLVIFFFTPKKWVGTPWKINGWNLQITHLERKMIFQASMIMFHVNLPGCTKMGRTIWGLVSRCLTFFFPSKSFRSQKRV